MKISRRDFLYTAGALSAQAQSENVGRIKQSPALDPNTLARFVDPLPIPPVAKPTETRGKAPFYRLDMREFRAQVHRDLPPTKMWGFDSSFPGPTIEARSGEALEIEWLNSLPAKHLLPIDYNLHGAEKDKPEVRAVVHVHGAKVPPGSDGYPDNWYVPGRSVTYHYPNEQESALLWYHDHTMGINRLNIYAGLFGLFIVRDNAEDALNLPKGHYVIPLVLCDRSFRRDGQLDYPVSGDPKAPWVPEAFGEAMLVNGKLFPRLDVEPRRYRFRLLNAANGRFFHLSLSNGQKFFQIGTDQGLLPAPVELDNFVIAPGERIDLVIDFHDHAGEQIVLANDAFQIMQFRVGKTRTPDESSLPASLRPVPRLLEKDAVQTRRLALTEYKHHTGESMVMLLNGMHWDMPVTEKPAFGSTEIWEIVNPTDDSHPIHLHLVRFQLLDRRNFSELAFRSTGQVKYTGPPVPPDPYEAGWKDTIRAHSLMVTRFIVRFEGYRGRYVWHCHILEHEDNEMMRPFEVTG